MSIKVPISEIPINYDFSKKTKIVVENKPFSVIRKEGDYLYVPYFIGKEIYTNDKKKPSIKQTFNGILREPQKEIFEQCLNFLKNDGCVISSCYTGFGKTITAIALACELKKKTLIIVTKKILMDQWQKAIELFTTTQDFSKSLVYTITTKEASTQYEACSFAIINAVNIKKINPFFLQSFGTVIVDELHLVLSEQTFKSLLHLSPNYLIGLTATSYRPDDLNQLFELFFGKNKIYKSLYCNHKVFLIKTGFRPLIKKTMQGRIDWNYVLNQQAENEPRNKLIIDIVKSEPLKNFLILVKRVSQGIFLKDRLNAEGILTSSLFGVEKTFDSNCRVLIGTTSKIGTGFDCIKLNALILAADVVEYYIQYLGRVMRTEESCPIVFDLIDDNPILKKHFNVRKTIYLKHGGIIEDRVLF